MALRVAGWWVIWCLGVSIVLGCDIVDCGLVIVFCDWFGMFGVFDLMLCLFDTFCLWLLWECACASLCF